MEILQSHSSSRTHTMFMGAIYSITYYHPCYVGMNDNLTPMTVRWCCKVAPHFAESADATPNALWSGIVFSPLSPCPVGIDCREWSWQFLSSSRGACVGSSPVTQPASHPARGKKDLAWYHWITSCSLSLSLCPPMRQR